MILAVCGAAAAAAVAAAQQCDGGGSLVVAAAAGAVRRGRTVRRRQAMDGVKASAMAINGTEQEGGTARGQREAMRQPARGWWTNRLQALVA